MRRFEPYAASAAIQRKIEEKHQIRMEEVEELFEQDPLVLRGETDQYGERRYVALGRTESGRYLLVVFTVPKVGKAKVITAREMTQREQRFYKSRG